MCSRVKRSLALAFGNEKAVLLLLDYQVADAKGGPEKHEANTAEFIFLKAIRPKSLNPRFSGPYRVTQRTSHAVRLEGKGWGNLQLGLLTTSELIWPSSQKSTRKPPSAGRRKRTHLPRTTQKPPSAGWKKKKRDSTGTPEAPPPRGSGCYKPHQ